MVTKMKETEEELQFRKQMEACESVFSSTITAELPEGTDYHYYKTFGDFKDATQGLQQRVKALMMRFPKAKGGVGALEDPEDALHWMVDLMDATLQRVDKAVDEGHKVVENYKKVNFQPHQGASALPAAAGQVVGTTAAKAGNRGKRRKEQWLEAQEATGHSQRPQDEHGWQVDNSNAPFKGQLDHWRRYVQEGESAPARVMPLLDSIREDLQTDGCPRPLQTVITNLQYPTSHLQPHLPQMYQGLDNKALQYVDTEEGLRGMVAALEGASELAVDLEHHCFRSFLGITCLMQVSDRTTDYVVDVIKLRPLIGPLLAPLFADPQVVKVLHGADWDILWLQRDFGIYVANLFDTGQACRVLKHPRLGLGHMLTRLCAVQTDKRYQLADWRIRPLPEEMLLYARMDTHYLLYMYDLLKAELVQAGDAVPQGLEVAIPEGKPGGALGTVLERSRLMCLKQYQKPQHSKSSYLAQLAQSKDHHVLSNQQLAVYASLFDWRNETARARDDSVDFVMSKRLLLSISKALPSTPKELKKAIAGNNGPSLVPAVTAEILEVVAEASQGEHGDERSKLAEWLAHQPPPGSRHAAYPAPPPTSPPSAAIPPPAASLPAAVPAAQEQQGPVLHTGLKPQEASPLPAQLMPVAAAIQEVSPPAARGQQSRAVAPSAQQGAPGTVTGARSTSPPDSEANGVDGEATSQAQATDSELMAPAQVVAPPAAPVAIRLTKPGKAGGMRALLGRNKKAGGSAMAGGLARANGASTPEGVSQETSGKAAADLVRSQFVVAYPALPAVSGTAPETSGVPEAVKDSPVKAEGAAGPSPVTGAVVRAAVTGIQGESDKQASRPLMASDPLEEYLSLSMNQRYPKYTRRDNGQARKPVPASDPMEEEADAQGEGEESEDGNDAVEAVMREAGLHSSSESDGEEPAERPSKRARKSQNGGTQEDGQANRAGRGSRAGGARKEEEGGGDEFGYDYCAARAAAPGLDLGLNGQVGKQARGRGRGRGGRGGGRTAKQKAPAASPPSEFNLYQLDESKFMKGGKRTATMPRSGNRNSTFR